MAVTIGHASIDERGKISGGSAGDQSGKEVCTRKWYSKPWTFVIRAKDGVVAEKMARICEAGCKNSNIGYDQNQRNTLFTKAKRASFDLSKIKTKCETDCSAFMSTCAYGAGIKLNMSGNAPTTSTMKSAFSKTGQVEILSGNKYSAIDKNLHRGDILVKPGSHTVMALTDGTFVACPYKTPTKSVTPESKTSDIKWLQWKLNNKSNERLDVDGGYGPLTQKAVLRLWKKLGWNKDGKDDGLRAGKSTREWLSKG